MKRPIEDHGDKVRAIFEWRRRHQRRRDEAMNRISRRFRSSAFDGMNYIIGNAVKARTRDWFDVALEESQRVLENLRGNATGTRP